MRLDICYFKENVTLERGPFEILPHYTSIYYFIFTFLEIWILDHAQAYAHYAQKMAGIASKGGHVN